MRRLTSVALVGTFLVALSGCGSSATGSGSTLRIVAGQNFWGSIATQLAGNHGVVQSVVTDPNADPHEYESNTNDARAFADADLVILNGAGYDDWGRKLLDANASSHRTVLTVANLLNKKSGDNPHFWYDPSSIGPVADRISSELERLDPAANGYFSQQRRAFDDALKPYRARIEALKQKFGGTAIGATEGILVYLANATGLNIISPPEFMKAVSQGNDPPAETVSTFQDQVTQKKIRVLVYNVQTSTLVTTNIKRIAHEHGLEVVGVSETMQPVTASFEDWQLAQLNALENALNASTLVK